MSSEKHPFRTMALVPPPPPERERPRPRSRWARLRCRLGWHRAQDCVDTGKWVIWGTRLVGGPLYECLCGVKFCRIKAALIVVPRGGEQSLCGTCNHMRKWHMDVAGRGCHQAFSCGCLMFVDVYAKITDHRPESIP